MDKNTISLLSKLGIKNKKEQIIVLTIVGVIFIYFVGYNIGTFISHVQNAG